ncbi:DUF4350 domain-containing protein [Chloroflexota bacterium]
MRVSSVLFPTVVLITVISLLSIWFYPSVQEFMASNTMWNGMNELRKEFRAEQIDSMDGLPDLPEKTVLVAISYLEYTDEELAMVKLFIDNGGALLLMDDYGYGNSVLEYLGADARFTNKPLLDPLFNYKNQSLPRITDFADEVKEDGIDVIMLNHATTLTNVTESSAIAWSSSASYLDMNENGVLDQGESQGPFVVAAEFRMGKGTLAIVSDPSIAINTMVDRDDNYDFIGYLSRNAGEQGRILVDNSHLTKAPLDVSKTRLIDTRKALSSPYALVGITAMIFVVVSRYTLKKGDIIG